MQLAQFFLRYPQFELTDSQIVGLFLQDAQLELNEKRWGKLYERGLMALTAHLLSLHLQAVQNDGHSHRLLASESAGELSVSYQPNASNGSDEFYQLTAYGQEYLRLRKLVGFGIMVA